MKAKRLFTLSALLAVMCMLVALLFGSTIGARTAKAEGVANGTTYEVSGEISVVVGVFTHSVQFFFRLAVQFFYPRCKRGVYFSFG